MPEALLILVFAAHVVAVNVAAVGPLACVWLERREGRGDPLAGQVGRWLARLSLRGLAVAVLLGVGLSALVWQLYPRVFAECVRQVPARRLWFGIAELGFSYVLMWCYAAGWERLARRRWLHRGLALLAATNLIYHFPLLFAAAAVLSERPELNIEPARFVSLFADPEVLARIVHHLLAAVAVTGTAVMAFTLRLPQPERAADVQRVAAWGGRMALVAAVMQMPAGLVLLMALPTVSRDRLLGDDWLAATMFGGGIAALLGLLHHLAAAALAGGDRTTVTRSLAWMALLIVFMAGARHAGRREVLEQRESRLESRRGILHHHG